MGYRVNYKRVLRLMREYNLLALRRHAFVATTDSNHDRCVYPNLVPGLNVSGVTQLWVSDLTYIRLAREWVYLAVVLDAHSRRCIGWALDRTLNARLVLNALEPDQRRKGLCITPIGACSMPRKSISTPSRTPAYGSA